MKKSVYLMTLLAVSGLAARADEQYQVDKNHPADLTEDYAGKLGVGIILGEPTGLSAKYWLNDTLAVDGAAGWSLHDDSDFYVHGDLLVHSFDLIPVPKGRLPVYIGGGGFVRFRDDHHDDEVGVRVPVGISYIFENAPVDIFAEIAPGMDVSPSTRFELMGGIGIRYWF